MKFQYKYFTQQEKGEFGCSGGLKWIPGIDKTTHQATLNYEDFTAQFDKIFINNLSFFVCSMCPYKTTKKSDLKKHFRTHTGERPFACSYCAYRAVQKHHLDTHVSRQHFPTDF